MNVALIINGKKEKAKQLATKAVKFLQDNKCNVAMPKEEAEDLEMSEFAASKERLANSDLVIVFGGDGTILRAVREVNYSNAPFIGVNLGKLGFLATVQPEKLTGSIELFLRGKYLVKKKRMLEWDIMQDSKTLVSGMALNDIAISRFRNQRLIRCEVYINGTHFFTYPSDGIVFASPTGSTAYSLSAGGPLVAHNCEVYIMTPVSPHSLFNRSIILAPNDKVEVKVEKDTFVLCDGQDVAKDEFSSLRVGLSDKYINFIDFPDNSFYAALKNKLITPNGLSQF